MNNARLRQRQSRQYLLEHAPRFQVAILLTAATQPLLPLLQNFPINSFQHPHVASYTVILVMAKQLAPELVIPLVRQCVGAKPMVASLLKKSSSPHEFLDVHRVFYLHSVEVFFLHWVDIGHLWDDFVAVFLLGKLDLISHKLYFVNFLHNFCD